MSKQSAKKSDKKSQLQNVERRALPRYSLQTDVEVLINSQDAELLFHTNSLNISLRGIELACDDGLIQAILAQKTYPYFCNISFSLPEYSKTL